MATDPVRGMTVGETALQVQHGGTTYYLCSEACRSAFLANPTRYTSSSKFDDPRTGPDARGAPDRGRSHDTEAKRPGRGRMGPVSAALIAFGLLLGIYFGLLTLVSGRDFALDQFGSYWPFILALAAGFAAQIGLYSLLRAMARHSRSSGRVIAVSGTTSTAAMVSCCAHYLTNVLPILGATGLASLATQYQVEFFWVGLAFNAAGIGYIAPKVVKASREHRQCEGHD